jgi:hypothetical protein
MPKIRESRHNCDSQSRRPIGKLRRSHFLIGEKHDTVTSHHRHVNMPSKSQQLANVKEPLQYDVLLGGGSDTKAHYGNVLWRALVDANVRVFQRQCTRDKSATAQSIVLAIRQQDPPGRFLQQDYFTGLWYDVGDIDARRRTLQALHGLSVGAQGRTQDEAHRGHACGLKFPSSENGPSVNQRSQQRSFQRSRATPSDQDSLDAMYQIVTAGGQTHVDSLIDIFAQAMGSDCQLGLTSEPVPLNLCDPSRSENLHSENGISTEMSYSARKLQGKDLDDIDERLSVMFRSVMSMGSTLSIGTFDFEESESTTSNATLLRSSNRLHKKPSINVLRAEPSNMSLLSMMSSD